jgi:hypothetical protein
MKKEKEARNYILLFVHFRQDHNHTPNGKKKYVALTKICTDRSRISPRRFVCLCMRFHAYSFSSQIARIFEAQVFSFRLKAAEAFVFVRRH